MREKEIQETLQAAETAKNQKQDSRLPSNSNPESNNIFNLRTLTECLANPAPEQSWLIDELLPLGGLSLDVAKPKVGKTTKNRTLARAVALGGEFLDREVMKTGKVIYYALEEKESHFIEKMANAAVVTDEILFHFGSAPKDPLKALQQNIEEHNPVLVIIDPLQRFLRVNDLNDYSQASNALEPVMELARKNNCHIMLTHHQSKSDRSGGDEVLGSTALYGAVDTLITTSKDAGGIRYIQTIQRYGIDLEKSVLNLDENNDTVTVNGTYAEFKRKNLDNNILQALGIGEMTTSDIRKIVGGNQTRTAERLPKMAEDGLLTRTGSGKKGDPHVYKVASDPASSMPDAR
ncbi:MAG: AAA family ATPase [Thermodesulfobacteriota bacterium]